MNNMFIVPWAENLTHFLFISIQLQSIKGEEDSIETEKNDEVLLRFSISLVSSCFE